MHAAPRRNESPRLLEGALAGSMLFALSGVLIRPGVFLGRAIFCIGVADARRRG